MTESHSPSAAEAPGKLFIVSNRLPVTIARSQEGHKVTKSSGGLVSGLRSLHEGSSGWWVGHAGLFEVDADYSTVRDQLLEDRLISVPLRKKSYQAYYNGLSNNAIWPLFHYFTNAMKFNLKEWEAYQEVNERFAETILQRIQPGDRVWVHDYQLMLLPRLLRRAHPDLRIAYFHHIPFPSSEVFRILPHREEVMRGLLGADYIGFHTYDYVRHFMSAVTRVTGADVHVDEINYSNRLIKVAAHPLGIDFEQMDAQTKKLATAAPATSETSSRPDDQVLFLGIDRLDYTKGIVERLNGFRTFLEQNPDQRGRASLVQLCVPSRADIQSYGNLRAQVERLVGQINGQYAKPGYTPVQYLYRSLPFEEVVRLYRTADVALVTPLRDGLNLVCKEYVAARDDEDGVLILSEFAGAATEMGEALKVNPYDVVDMANAMETAISMPRDERRRRMQLLRRRVQEFNNIKWGERFVESWDRAHDHARPRSVRLEGSSREEILTQLAEAPRLHLFLDNDGTLTPIASRPELAIPSEATRVLLRELCELAGVSVTIVTGRPRDFCEQYFVDLPVNIVAEHGAFVWHNGRDAWQSQLGLEEFENLLPDLNSLLSMYTQNVPGSHIERKETGLVWHYRLAEPTFAESQAKELTEALQQMLGKTSLSVFPGKKTVEIRQVMANKGYGVEYFLETLGFDDLDAMATVGDDTTDEDMHRVHRDRNFTIHIGKPNVFARYFLEDPADFHRFLAKLRDLRRQA